MADEIRIGHGYDIHRFRDGGRLWIGGVAVADGYSADAHSDGDVAIHSLVDAILGALGLGDIGEHFPNTDPQWKDAPSRVFLEHAVQLAAARGYKVSNADITILAEKPRLNSHKPQMVAELSAAVGAPVGVKAGTNEGCDAVGQGKAVAAHAVVLLVRR